MKCAGNKCMYLKRTKTMRRICFIIMLFLCFALQGCEKVDYQENKTVTYVNSSESRESEDTPETKEDDTNLNIQDLDMIPQCFWGTWVMTEELHGKDGWVECRNEFQGLSVKFTPTGFTFQNDYSEVSGYSCSFIAIADIDGYYREAGQFQELGLVGDYYLKFYPEWDNHEDEIGWLWEYILVSETELIIPEARNGMYKMKKVAEYT